jgi:hypothetical protein
MDPNDIESGGLLKSSPPAEDCDGPSPSSSKATAKLVFGAALAGAAIVATTATTFCSSHEDQVNPLVMREIPSSSSFFGGDRSLKDNAKKSKTKEKRNPLLIDLSEEELNALVMHEIPSGSGSFQYQYIEEEEVVVEEEYDGGRSLGEKKEKKQKKDKNKKR